MAVLFPVPVVPSILKCLVSSSTGTGTPARVSPAVSRRRLPRLRRRPSSMTVPRFTLRPWVLRVAASPPS